VVWLKSSVNSYWFQQPFEISEPLTDLTSILFPYGPATPLPPACVMVH
jgi:hypothetical protein